LGDRRRLAELGDELGQVAITFPVNGEALVDQRGDTCPATGDRANIGTPRVPGSVGLPLDIDLAHSATVVAARPGSALSDWVVAGVLDGGRQVEQAIEDLLRLHAARAAPAQK
jgi:hypothetical protein